MHLVYLHIGAILEAYRFRHVLRDMVGRAKKELEREKNHARFYEDSDTIIAESKAVLDSYQDVLREADRQIGKMHEEFKGYFPEHGELLQKYLDDAEDMRIKTEKA